MNLPRLARCVRYRVVECRALCTHIAPECSALIDPPPPDLLRLDPTELTQLGVADLSGVQHFTPRIIEPVLKERVKHHTIAPFLNENSTLKRLVDLGMDLSQVEQVPGAGQMLLNKKWDSDVVPVLACLIHCGIPVEKLGSYLTRNPYVFTNDVKDLVQRVNYLKSKKFSQQAISKIVLEARYWLNFDSKEIDNRLGWLQTEFGLKGNEIRFIVTKAPIVINLGTGKIQMMNLVLQEQLGFTYDELKQMILIDPKLWISENSQVAACFDYLHNVIGFSHRRIILITHALRYPLAEISNRHEFLKWLGRDQYNPDKPHYVTFEDVLVGSDQQFCTKLDVNVNSFNDYIKFNL